MSKPIEPGEWEASHVPCHDCFGSCVEERSLPARPGRFPDTQRRCRSCGWQALIPGGLRPAPEAER